MSDSSRTPSAGAGGTTFFFAVALGFTWALQLPALLAQRGVLPGGVGPYVPLAAVGGFGPLIAALLAARRESGAAGVRALFEPSRCWRVRPGWYLLALVGFAAIHLAGMAVWRAFGGHGSRWLYLPEQAQHVAAMLVVPLAEEPGWRGFALPRLQRRMGALAASLVLGGLWAAWHGVMFALQGFSAPTFGVAVLNIVAGSVVFGWLYNRTGGSLLVAVVAHLGAHLNNPTHALPAAPTPFVVYTASICATACALVLVDRSVFQPQRG